MRTRPIDHHRQLIVWQRAMELLGSAYALARDLPRHETFGMASQMRRAATSIPSNIAEGHARVHRGDFVHHLSIARGSLAELETLIDACESLGYAAAERLVTARGQADEVRRMLATMIVRLRAKPAGGER
ncbi:MAG: four helix bundle protein [Gemmatirosa sp.]|nr:four helix bundle protein [Gemmatirosa sp.]